MVITTKFEFESWLCEGKVLTTLTFVVLNGNRLVRFAIGTLAYAICFLSVIKRFKMKGIAKRFLLWCLTRLWVSLMCILRCDEEFKATLFFVANFYWLVNFSERYLVAVKRKTLFATQNMEKRTLVSRQNITWNHPELYSHRIRAESILTSCT